jgi:hypothetical protein
MTITRIAEVHAPVLRVCLKSLLRQIINNN